MIESIFGIIPARGGSKRLPGKNLMQFGGMSLLERTIRQAKKALPVSLVSSENSEIIREANRCGISALLRPLRLAADDTTMEAVMDHVLNVYPVFDWFCLLQVTSPLRTLEDIQACLKIAEDTQRPVVSTCFGKRNGAVYIGKASQLPTLFFKDCVNYEMPPERSVDIDTIEDFTRAEMLLNGSKIRTASTGSVLPEMRDQQPAPQ